jgi:predicted small lipoprotein YifL
MKKFIALILAFVMMLTLVACGNKDPKPTDPSEPTAAPTDPTEPTLSKEELAAKASIEEIAKALLNKYVEFAGMRTQYDEYMKELDEADRIPFEEFVSYQVACNPIEKGTEWLTGFNTVPTGFSEAYCYQPQMMGQAFIGYIFRVADGTDIEAFKTNLKATCEPRWNICTMANTTVCESYGNIVYFSMMVVIDNEHPDGFTAQQKDEFYNTFIATIENPTK